MRPFSTRLRASVALTLIAALALAPAGVSFAQTQPSSMHCDYSYLCVDYAGGSPTYASVTLGGVVGANTSYGTAIGTGATLLGQGTVIGALASLDATSNGFLAGSSASMLNGAQGVTIGDVASMNGVSGVTIGSSASAAQTQLPLAYRFYVDSSSVTVGNYSASAGVRNVTIGEEAQSGWKTTDTDNVTVGARGYTEGQKNATLGAGARVWHGGVDQSDPVNSVAIGADTNVTESWVVGFGNRRLTQIVDGTALQDAATINQLSQSIGSLGGGASLVSGVYKAPTFNLSTGTYHDVGSALAGLDSKAAAGGGTIDPLAVHYDDAGSASITLQGGSTAIHNVAPGVEPGDAVNYSQLDTSRYNVTSTLGGGASYVGGVFTGPTFTLTAIGAAGSYSTVGAALSALDTSVNAVNTRIDNLPSGGTGNGLPWMMTDAPNVAATVAGTVNTAIGPGSAAGAVGSSFNFAAGSYSQAGTTGGGATGNGGQNTAVGVSATSNVLAGTAVGQGTVVTANFATAIGQGSVGDQENTVSVGSATNQRRIVNVANGIFATDVATVGQLSSVVGAFGGGASLSAGYFTPPSYLLSGQTFGTVGDALTFLDGRINSGNGGGPIGPAGPAGPQGPQGPKGDPGVNTGGGTDTNAVHYDAGSSETSVTLQGSGGTQIHNVRAGVADTDAANVGQVSAQVQQAINTAKSYADAGDAATAQQARAYTDWKVGKFNDRLDRTQALGTAQTQMVATFAGADPSHSNRIAAGTGFAGRQSAVSVGYQHVTENRHLAWNVGGAIAGQERTIGAGVGYSW